MMKDEALKILGLPESAGPEEIEAAYRRLVRRYPPEFQPEKFRRIDEAWRFLTSLACRVESLLAPREDGGTREAKGSVAFFNPPPAPGAAVVEEAAQEIRKAFKLAYLFGRKPG